MKCLHYTPCQHQEIEYRLIVIVTTTSPRRRAGLRRRIAQLIKHSSSSGERGEQEGLKSFYDIFLLLFQLIKKHQTKLKVLSVSDRFVIASNPIKLKTTKNDKTLFENKRQFTVKS